jgi:hypothetical protein
VGRFERNDVNDEIEAVRSRQSPVLVSVERDVVEAFANRPLGLPRADIAGTAEDERAARYR